MSELISFLGIIFLILFIVHQFTKKTPEFLQNEKMRMEEKIEELKKGVTKWKDHSLKDLTNDMQYSFVKSMTNVVSGVIKSKDNLPILAFQRIDRGIFINSKIIAISTDFKVYCEYKNNERLFFFDNTYLGKITDNSDMFDSTNKKIGNCNRNVFKSQTTYTIEFNSIKAAEIKKNSDRKTFVNQTYYNSSESNWSSSKTFREVEPPFTLIKSINTIDKEELKWITSIVIFESIYYGFDFTS